MPVTLAIGLVLSFVKKVGATPRWLASIKSSVGALFPWRLTMRWHYLGLGILAAIALGFFFWIQENRSQLSCFTPAGGATAYCGYTITAGLSQQVKVCETPGKSDPATGLPCLAMTPEVQVYLKESDGKASPLWLENPEECFRRIDGQPKVWVCRPSPGQYRLAAIPIFDPSSGKLCEPITPEFCQQHQQQHQTAVRQKAEREAEDARQEAEQARQEEERRVLQEKKEREAREVEAKEEEIRRQAELLRPQAYSSQKGAGCGEASVILVDQPIHVHEMLVEYNTCNYGDCDYAPPSQVSLRNVIGVSSSIEIVCGGRPYFPESPPCTTVGRFMFRPSCIGDGPCLFGPSEWHLVAYGCEPRSVSSWTLTFNPRAVGVPVTHPSSGASETIREHVEAEDVR
ncbi:hypothetical protein HY546_00300, partial [archaeon]|nr:hypothetical protein [archaeon]